MTVAEQIAAEEKLGDVLGQYAGKWVAVEDHQVVASADSLEQLLEQIPEHEVSQVEVFQAAEDSSACFY